jgi:site-specific DNA-methyltransferase (cytosine-N4-specific)
MTAAARADAGAQPVVPTVAEAYKTKLGTMYQGTIEDFLEAYGKRYRGKVQLVFFSPPFPLKRKKKYGNKTGDEYVKWLADLAPKLADLLTDDGSLVIEVGNAWDPGHPTMSLLPVKSLIEFAERGELKVCQQFICNNPARLPSPIQWVNIERIRVKDSFTHVWWMSKVEKPKVRQRSVLREYSDSMKKLLKTRRYNAGARPSEHVIGETSFLTDNGGAIPPSVLEFSNTRSASPYRRYVKARGLKAHPAPMQGALAEWFIKFLTDENDLVLDPFGGSNTTGATAEQLRRKWISVEPMADYIEGSKGRFPQFGSVPDPERVTARR